MSGKAVDEGERRTLEAMASPPGFDGAPEAFLVFGVTVELAHADAHRLAERVMAELPDLALIPEGGRTRRGPEESVLGCLGIVVARARVDASVGEEVAVSEDDIEAARVRWVALETKARALVDRGRLDPEAETWLIPSGPLARASLAATDGGRVELPLTLRGSSFTLRAAFD
ncbi:MAG: hypothetical protein VYE22_03215 [Myxococcota bacterium]|nr:hypothetical protein [Myxococcota bacterium]